MKSLLSGIIILFSVTSAFAQSKRIGTFQFENKVGHHAARVIFSTKSFQRSKYKITDDNKYQTRVDGRLAIGTDGNIPSVEISSMQLYFDGKEMKISSRLYSDCYEPNFDNRAVTIKFGHNFQSVIVSMAGSDGAGGYEVIWRLRKNGHHTRSISQGF